MESIASEPGLTSEKKMQFANFEFGSLRLGPVLFRLVKNKWVTYGSQMRSHKLCN